MRTLGDVNCDGRVELADAALLAAYVANPSDAAVSSLRIGQPGGYSLYPVMEVVWGSILGTAKKDPTVAQILAGVPVLLSGVLPVSVDGEDRVYLGIDRAYWDEHGGKQLYEALKQRLPATLIHVEPSIGVIRHSGKVATRPTTTAIRNVAPVTRLGPPIFFAESPNAVLPDNSKAQKVVGSITVPDDVTVGSVSVAVDITHPSRGDLKVDLVAPSGVVVSLYNGTRSGVDLADHITGTIATTDALQGQRAQGTWQLRVGDYEQGAAGTLNAWNLTVTPAQDAPATEEPVNLFLDTFQDGLGAWRTTAWEAASLDTDSGVPGEGPGNIVAKAEGCSVCFLTLETPVDLSAHDSVTLSFYRWLDSGMSNSEFLGVDIGNNGSYQRLQNWNGQYADGQWHLETFTLSGDQISDRVTLRFFGITQNNFTTVAIDNVMIAATPGSVVVTPDTTPDLAVTATTATSPTAAPQASLTIQTTIQNTNAPAETRTVHVYRHNQTTDTPPQGGTIVSVIGAVVQTDATRIVQTNTTAPAEEGTYYYYSCVSELEDEADTTNNCATTPATVAVQASAETPNESTTQEPTTAQETPSAAPDLAVNAATASPIAPQSGDVVTIRTTIRNKGTATAPQKIVRVYRHTERTSTPTTGGVRESNTTTTPTLAPNASVTVTSTQLAPAVTSNTAYYYYVCVDTAADEQVTDNNCSLPAIVVVRPKPTEVVPTPEDDSRPMGGDRIGVRYLDPQYGPKRGTLTLGGIETTDGVPGFVVSAHVVAPDDPGGAFIRDYTVTDALVGEAITNIKMNLYGKVFRMPTVHEGIHQGVTYDFISVDAAFVAYPRPASPDCSLPFKQRINFRDVEYCLDVGGSAEYLEKVAPLKIRGKDDVVYTVIDSQDPEEDMEVWFSGSRSGVVTGSVVKEVRVLVGNEFLTFAYGNTGMGGDSGSPVYTVPDTSGNVHIVGVLEGYTERGTGC